MWKIAAFCLALLTIGCASQPARPPAWTSGALGGDADIVVAADLQRLHDDAVLAGLTTDAQQALPLGMGWIAAIQQIDAVARVERGDVRTWIIVLHGPSVDMPRILQKTGFVEGSELPSGALEFKAQRRAGVSVFVFPSEWVLTGGAEEAVRGMSPSEASARVSMSSDSVLEFVLRGKAVERVGHEWGRERDTAPLLEGLQEVSGRLRLRAERLLTVRARYATEEDAQRAEKAMRVLRALLHSRGDRASRIARWLVKEEVERSGREVVTTLTIAPDSHPPDLRPERPRPPPIAPYYEGRCGAGERFDLDRRRCVEAR